MIWRMEILITIKQCKVREPHKKENKEQVEMDFWMTNFFENI